MRTMMLGLAIAAAYGGAAAAQDRPKQVIDELTAQLEPTRTVVYKTVGERELRLHLFLPEGHKPSDLAKTKHHGSAEFTAPLNVINVPDAPSDERCDGSKSIVKGLTGNQTLAPGVYGNLTIKDTTREVALDVERLGVVKDPWGNERAAFSAKTSVNRGDFGLTWNQALETGGVMVGDRIDIEIEIEAVRQADAKTA